MYYAQRQQVVGSGYAQQVQWVNVPLCKACGERVQVFLTEEERFPILFWFKNLSFKRRLLVSAVLIGGCIAIIVLFNAVMESYFPWWGY